MNRKVLWCRVIHSKKKGKTTGWIGYTLSFSERKFEGLILGSGIHISLIEGTIFH